jgi:hypothetical protein
MIHTFPCQNIEFTLCRGLLWIMALCGSAYDQQRLVQNVLFLTTGLLLFLPTLNHGPSYLVSPRMFESVGGAAVARRCAQATFRTVTVAMHLSGGPRRQRQPPPHIDRRHRTYTARE